MGEPERYSVRVPASTSNLGPGFDFLGLALDLWLEATIQGSRSEGATGTVEPDLVTLAFERACRAFECESRARVATTSSIPIGRGLGSSGAAIVAGILLARALAEREIADDELLALAVSLEGHPDNVTAALFGGLTIGVPLPTKEIVRVNAPLSSELGFAVAWPAEPLPTKRARAVLPDAVPFADAVENPRRLALLLEGLRTGDPRLLALGGEDRLHVRHRVPLIPGAARALERAREAGAHLATLSGAGSGILAIGARSAMEPIARAMADALSDERPGAEARVLEPVLGRPVVRALG